MKSKTIKLMYSDFWPTFNRTGASNDNYFQRLLGSNFRIEPSEKPDFLIYSVFGNAYRNYDCVKIFYTGENIRPNFVECDFAFSFDHLLHRRHYRLPLYGLYLEDPIELIKPKLDYEKILAKKTDFCNFIYSNTHAPKRNEFYAKLSHYKKIDSGGGYLNNLGYRVHNKAEFLKRYKFTIAFENSEYPGYTTEKLIQPMLADSLPIYWGNELVDLDFNTKSFLNYYDYATEAELIERIIELDNNDDLYLEYLSQPFYHDNQVNEFIKPENVLKQFELIFEGK
jgi:hypothetical protein